MMTDLDELRRVLAEREALAPDPTGIVAAARVRGARIRRVRTAGALAGTMAAVLAAGMVGTALLGHPPATQPAAGATPTVTGGWPVVPSYHGPAVPGQPAPPGPTGIPAQPVSGRSIDPVVPYSLTLPAGWRGSGWWYQEGDFRGTYVGPAPGMPLLALDVLDPATQPASLRHPSGDPATGRVGPDGTLAWLADDRHFVRVQLQGDVSPQVLRGIVTGLDFAHQRHLLSPFTLDYLPAGLHLTGADIRLPEPGAKPGSPYWGVTLWFDYGTGRTGTVHDLQVQFDGEVDPASQPPNPHPVTVAGHQAAYQPTPDGRAMSLVVYGVQGHNPYFTIGNQVRNRITLSEAGRIVNGMRFAPQPADPGSWGPLRTP